RDALAHRDLLRAQDLLDRFRPPRPRLDRGVVRNDDDGAAAHPSQPGHDARGRRLTVVLVVGHEQSDFEPAAVWVEQCGDPLARRQLALLVLPLDALRAAALLEAGAELLVFVAEALEAGSGWTHAARCSAAHSWMYLMRSAVGVPGPNSLPVPCASSAAMSSGGMMP